MRLSLQKKCEGRNSEADMSKSYRTPGPAAQFSIPVYGL